MPVPLAARRDRWHYRLDGGKTVLIAEGASDSDAPLGETYLRLMEVDLDDPDSILDFVNGHAALGVNRGHFNGLSHEHDWPILDYLTVNTSPRVLTEARAAANAARDEIPYLEKDGTHWHAEDDPRLETLAEFRLGATLVRDALRGWLALQDNLRFGDVHWESDEIRWEEIHGREPERWRRRLVRNDVAIQALVNGLIEYGFSEWGPGLAPATDPLDEELGTNEDLAPREGPSLRVSAAKRPVTQNPSLLSCLCLELYNHIAENAVYKRCQNETCGALFVRQDGRSAAGQHRTRGVMYCKRKCANAQAQRARRHRLKAAA